jgi:hypothetical protein
MSCHIKNKKCEKKMESWKIVKVCTLWNVTRMCTIVKAKVFCGRNPMNKILQ